MKNKRKMKRICPFLVLIALFALSAPSAKAQGWLNKVTKAIDRVDKHIQTVEETLLGPIEETPEPKNETAAIANKSQMSAEQIFRNVKTYTNDAQVPVKFVSCIRNGEDVTIEFQIGNYTETDIEIRKFGSNTTQGFTLTEASAIADDAGYNYEISSATVGGKTEGRYTGNASINGFFNLSKETTVRASMVIKKVNASATSFQVVKIAFNNTVNGSYFTRYFSFKNVPILSAADIAGMEQEAKQKEFQLVETKANVGDTNTQYTVDKSDKHIQTVEETPAPRNETATQITENKTQAIVDKSQMSAEQIFRNVETFTNDAQVPVKFVSCIRNGEDVTIEFQIGNYTETDIEIQKFGSNKTQGFTLTEASAIADDAGYNYEISSATVGGKTEGRYTGNASINGFFNLSKETTVRASMVIKKVNASATSFQVVKIAFNNMVDVSYFTRYFSFKNVPILSAVDIAQMEQNAKQREFERMVTKANAGDANMQYAVGKAYFDNGDDARAIEYLTKSADGGNADAQGIMAEQYLYGLSGLTKDPHKALAYAQKAKDKGNVLGYYVLGRLYYNNEVVESDENKAIEYFTYAANRDNADAQNWLGVIYKNMDQTLSALWAKKAADNGKILGIQYTGNNYLNGSGLPADKQKALFYYLKGVEQNDAECLYSAGLMYRRGWGCNQDLAKAKELLHKSAAQDNVNGYRELGYFYRFNEVDDLKAIDYFNRAIAEGDPHSLPDLGEMYEKGIGTLKNPTKAKQLYMQSAENGNKDSQYKLGMMAKRANDLKGAFGWFSKSADADQSDAQYELGLMYYYAKGTIKNNKKAAEYIEKAHKQGNKEAEKIWDSLQLWKYI